MRVMLLSPTQNVHTTIATMVAEEIKLFKGSKVTSVLSGAVFAVAVRITAIANSLLWAACEIPCFVPRLFVVAANLLGSSHSSLITTLWRTIKVFSLVIRISALQGLSFGCAAILPELLYPQLKVHKTLFSLHVQALLETLPDFPVVDQSMYKNIQEGFLDPLAKVWYAAGLKSNEMRNLLQEKLFIEFDKSPASASELLDTESVAFRRIFCTTLSSKIAKVVNTNVDQAVIRHLCPFVFGLIYNDLSYPARQEINALRPDLMSAIENDVPYTHAMSYRYLHPQDKQLSEHFLEKMVVASQELIKNNVCTAEAIEYQMAYREVVLVAIYRFIASAKVAGEAESHFVVPLKTGEEISIQDDHRFFGARQKLIEIHQMVTKLNAAQKELLVQRLYLRPTDPDQEVTNCFAAIGALETNLINPQVTSKANLSEKDMVPWEQAFLVGDQAHT